MKIKDIKSGDEIYVVYRKRLVRVHAHIPRNGVPSYIVPGRYGAEPFCDDACWTVDELPAVRKQRAAEARAQKKAELERAARRCESMKIAIRLSELGVAGLYQKPPTANHDGSIPVVLTQVQARMFLTWLEAEASVGSATRQTTPAEASEV